MSKEELKVVENGMVPVYETDTGEWVVYGTELHKVLGVKSHFRDWVKNRLKDVEALENDDYETSAKNLAGPNGGGPIKEYIIKLDIAKEMAMLERNPKGKQVRRYFIQVEKKYKTALIELADSLKTFMLYAENRYEEQSNFNHMVLERIERLDNISMSGTRSVNPFGFSDVSINDERMKELNSMISEVAELYEMERNKTLHFLYKTMEEDLGISLNSYLAVYRAESNSKDSCVLHVITANDRLYYKAKELCEDAIQRKRVFG